MDGEWSPRSPRDNSSNTYIDTYNKMAQTLRDALLQHGADSSTQRQVVRNIFRRMDDNGSGVLTIQELREFVQSPELGLFENNPAMVEKFSRLLIEQIDINGNGDVSLEELEAFVFPKRDHGSRFEIGIMLDLCRRALIQLIGASGAAATGSDETLLAEFVKLSKSTVKRGGQVEARVAIKSFENLKVPEIGRPLSSLEIEQLMQTLDTNQDGVISAKDFKQWLFPQHRQDDHSALSKYLTALVEEKFHGSLRELFNSFQGSGSTTDRIYKSDFITNIKALDPGLPRQFLIDLATALSDKDKSISYASMLDFVDRRMIQHHHYQEARGGSEQGSISPRSTRSTTNSVDMSFRRSQQSFSCRSVDEEEDSQRSVEDVVGGVIDDLISIIESQEAIEEHQHTHNRSYDQQSVMSSTSSHQKIPHLRTDHLPREHSFRRTDSSKSMSVSPKAHSPLTRQGSFGTGAGQHNKSTYNMLMMKSNQVILSEHALQQHHQQHEQDQKQDRNKPSQQQLDEARDLIDSNHHHRQQEHSFDMTASYSRSSLSPEPRNKSPHHAKSTDQIHGAAGYTAHQLVEFGYHKHTGRWRGFPFDSWSCCSTNLFICPNAPKVNKLSPMLSKQTLFIHTDHIEPHAKDESFIQEQEERQVNQEMMNESLGERRTMRIRRYHDPPPRSMTRPSSVISHAKIKHSSPHHGHVQSHHQQEDIKTKLKLQPEDLMIKPMTLQFRPSCKAIHQKKQAVTRVNNPNAASIRSGYSLTSPPPPPPSLSQSTKQQQYHQQAPPQPPQPSTRQHTQQQRAQPQRQQQPVTKIIERIIVQHQPALPTQSPSIHASPALEKEVDQLVKKSTAGLLSAYDHALRDLRKELELTRLQADAKKSKTDLSLQRQEHAIDELKTYVQSSFQVFKRSVVESIQRASSIGRTPSPSNTVMHTTKPSSPPSSAFKESAGKQEHEDEHENEHVPSQQQSAFQVEELTITQPTTGVEEGKAAEYERRYDEKQESSQKICPKLASSFASSHAAKSQPPRQRQARPQRAFDSSSAPLVSSIGHSHHRQNEAVAITDENKVRRQHSPEQLRHIHRHPWVPNARHANNLFNRVAVKNTSKAHSAAPTKKEQHLLYQEYEHQHRHEHHHVSSKEMSTSVRSRSGSPVLNAQAAPRYLMDVKVIHGGHEKIVRMPSPSPPSSRASVASKRMEKRRLEGPQEDYGPLVDKVLFKLQQEREAIYNEQVKAIARDNANLATDDYYIGPKIAIRSSLDAIIESNNTHSKAASSVFYRTEGLDTFAPQTNLAPKKTTTSEVEKDLDAEFDVFFQRTDELLARFPGNYQHDKSEAVESKELSDIERQEDWWLRLSMERAKREQDAFRKSQGHLAT